ncbi:MAG TPA: Fic family protein [candidate division Zixibacteria bacterium]|nr:Fic family protein [candidate division Zixibacteria bacterium]
MTEMAKPERDSARDTFFGLAEKLEPHAVLRQEISVVLGYQVAVHSCAIENRKIHPIFLQLPRSLESIRQWERPLPEYHQLLSEVQGYLLMLASLEDLVSTRRRLTTSGLAKMHRLIFERSNYGQAGQFRRTNQGASSKSHPLPHYTLVPEMLDHHLAWLDERLPRFSPVSPGNFAEVFQVIAESYYRIAHTSPFEIGNGSIARAMESYILLSAGMFYHIPCFENHSSMHKAVQSATIENLTPIVNELLTCYQQTLKLIEGFAMLVPSEHAASVATASPAAFRQYPKY